MVATMMVITMRGVVIMMKAQDSLQDLIFQNLKEEYILMTSWIGLIHVFEYCDPLEHKWVKLVAIKMHKNASFWWENLKRHRERNGKKNIQT